MTNLLVSILVAVAGNTIEAQGTGKPPAGKTGPQARLMARRAAEVVAIRNLGLAEAGIDTNIRTGTIQWSGVVRDYRTTRVTTAPDGTVTVTIQKAPNEPIHPKAPNEPNEPDAPAPKMQVGPPLPGPHQPEQPQPAPEPMPKP